jgi:transposase
MISNANTQARKKCFIVYLRAKGLPRYQIADIARVDECTVTQHVSIYADSGLAGLLQNNYRKPKSQLEPHTQAVKELFNQKPPHTVNQAIEMIFEKIGIRLKHSACQAFLKN